MKITLLVERESNSKNMGFIPERALIEVEYDTESQGLRQLQACATLAGKFIMRED